ncbi:MAG TPA: ribosome maturation factor RimM [Candidatus Sulfotelmatobacter sp.]|nr:ribosome maturation factor RimM [Candidatus Sulfotelmatobacter sp.]
MSPESSGEFITLARVVKTQGRHGEVAVEVHSDVPERFKEGMKLLASPEVKPGGIKAEEIGARRELEVEGFWPHKNWLVLKFRGVDSMTDAEALIGTELQVPRAERAALETGWTYVSDLVGCKVFDQDRDIGRLEDVQFGAGEAPLLIVGDASGKKYDVPFAEAYLDRVDVGRGEIRMKLPEGMLAINAPMTAEEKEQQKKRDF